MESVDSIGCCHRFPCKPHYFSHTAGDTQCLSFCLNMPAFLQSSLSVPLFCCISSLIVQQQFLHSALLSLCYSHMHTHTHFLTLALGQQIRPSYQQFSREQNAAESEMHVPASSHSATEVKVSHMKPRPAPQLTQYRHPLLETRHCAMVTHLFSCPLFSRICLRSWIRRISVSTFIR